MEVPTKCTLEHDPERGEFRVSLIGDKLAIAHLLASALWKLYRAECNTGKEQAAVAIMFQETFNRLEKEGGKSLGEAEASARSENPE